jgi:hypothetical protein
MRGVKAIMNYAIADYIVTGEPDPDCKGNYYYGGEFYMHPYYIREDTAWCLWWTTVGTKWIISTGLAQWSDYRWENPTADICGAYDGKVLADGTAYVSQGDG